MRSAGLIAELSTQIDRAVEAVAAISAVPAMLSLISRQSRMRFSAVAHVTDVSWTACAVHDELDFGLAPGSQLDIDATLNKGPRAMVEPIAMNHASVDPTYSSHLSPKLLKFESYVSVPIILRSGEYFGNLCALDPLPNEVANASILGMFSAYAELIGHLLDAEREQVESRRQLDAERSVAFSREQFIAVVAHDLRNPLAAMNAGAALVARNAEPQVAQVGERMRLSAKRMAALLNDLVDFSKGRSGSHIQIGVSERPDLGADMLQAVEELQWAHPEQPLECTFDFTRPVLCDVARIQQLLSNLLGNAITYGDPGFPIKVEGYIEAGEVVLTITNRGKPIPAEHLAKIYDPYWRASEHPGDQSMGLGLHICSQIVNAHRGRIIVTSSLDEGTCFLARWPVLSQSAS